MKTRYSLVSNSSSTSFCIYGSHFEGNPFSAEVIRNIKKNKPEIIDEFIKKYESKSWHDKEILNIFKNIDTASDEDFETIIEECDQLLPDGLGYHSCQGESFWIGRSLNSIGDNETGKEFKDSTEKLLKSVFGDSITCHIYEESWYDG